MDGELAFDGRIGHSLGDWSAMIGSCPLWLVPAGIKRFKHSGMGSYIDGQV